MSSPFQFDYRPRVRQNLGAFPYLIDTFRPNNLTRLQTKRFEDFLIF